MLYFIKSKNYDFFLSEKDKVKNKRQINNEYIIEDISLILDTVFSFGQDGFFKTEKTILIFKRILKDINFEDIEKVINVLISANVPIIFFESEDNLKFEKYILSKDGFVIKEPEKKSF
jgi:hypothetical protein